MAGIVKVRYVGPHDEVEFDISEHRVRIPARVKRNHQIEVPHVVAYGRPPSSDQSPWLPDAVTPNPDYDQGQGGLLDQVDNWQLVESRRETAEKSEARE